MLFVRNKTQQLEIRIRIICLLQHTTCVFFRVSGPPCKQCVLQFTSIQYCEQQQNKTFDAWRCGKFFRENSLFYVYSYSYAHYCWVNSFLCWIAFKRKTSCAFLVRCIRSLFTFKWNFVVRLENFDHPLEKLFTGEMKGKTSLIRNFRSYLLALACAELIFMFRFIIALCGSSCVKIVFRTLL